MDYGIFIPPVATSWKLVQRAEALGYSRAWFYDTELLNTELFVAMTAAAMNTSRIRIGSGVMIPSNRIAPVAASGLASINALAPGRVDFGIGTGFTARRTVGHPPVKIAEMAEYVRVVQALLAGETVEWESEGKRRKIRFLDPRIGAIEIGTPIPLHVSAFGPKGRELTAGLGAGWIGAVANVGHGKAGVGEMRKAWVAAGLDPAGLSATAILSGAVLRPGEPIDSARVKALTGPHATMVLHSLAERDEFGDLKRPIPPAVVPLVERYNEIYRGYAPADARYLSNHRGHLMYLRPEEHELCTPELIRTMTFTATKPELQEMMRELKHAGFTHIGVNVGYGYPERLEEWADVLEGV